MFSVCTSKHTFQNLKNFKCHLFIRRIMFNIVDQSKFSCSIVQFSNQNFLVRLIFFTDIKQLQRAAGLTMGVVKITSKLHC